MNLEMQAAPLANQHAEQGILGALLRDNDAIDRIGDLLPTHFYNPDHALIFREIVAQVTEKRRADVITVLTALQGKIANAGSYLSTIAQNTPSAAHIERHAAIVIDKATKRGLLGVAGELSQWVNTSEDAEAMADRAAARIEALVRRVAGSDPVAMRDLLPGHMALMEKRLDKNEDVMPLSTGWPDLDRQLGGGLRRKTLTILAARPAMGKTAFGLGIGRNIGERGAALFLSMEMPAEDVMDRNIAGLGKLPLDWVMDPSEDPAMWSRLTHAYQKADESGMHIDDQTGLNMLKIRAKARMVKRKAGKLDILIVDQLSFITGSEQQNRAYALGEYTRGLIAIGKELDCAVLLLCQLNRDCEKRPDKRPMCSDLADSGSIEQDAATIIFLYRDEVYNPDSQDKGICEVIIGKARQGKTGMVGLAYIGDQTRFESLARPYIPQPAQQKGRSMADRL